MRTFWAMNYERLNANFKQPTHVMNNYRNVPLTLAKKHQCSVLEAQLSKDYLSDAIDISSIVEANISDFPTTDLVDGEIGLNEIGLVEIGLRFRTKKK